MHILQAGVFAFLVTISFSLFGINGTRTLISVYFLTAAFWLLVIGLILLAFRRDHPD
ncbi:MAG: hypothetical protein ABJZ83_11940 [Yoonia sp.]|uniref:hypothetical protein n=1 Tax=Yoonia sp. TaxID=2212373 RepID=UPI00329765EE